jgi:hypothetical protein
MLGNVQKWLIAAGFGAGLLIGGSTIAIGFWHFQPQRARADVASASDHDVRMNACIAKTLEITKPTNVNVDAYERVWRLCGNEMFNSVYLADFLIRREKFTQQALDERVNLWLVVTITISGVVLAGIQLFMSFKLAMKGRAEFGKDSEVALESGRLSLKSSITGAVILALSFAFFMVYVIWIYSIHEMPFAKPDNLQPPVEYASPER